MPQGYFAGVAGDWYKNQNFTIVNRTGAALAIGDLAAINLDFVNTTYDELVPGETNFLFANCVAVTTENAARILCVATKAIASGEAGPMCFGGIVPIKVNGGNPGEYIVGTNAQVYATPYTLTELDGLGAPTGIVGTALEASAGVQVKKCLFDGFALFHLIGGGA